MSLSSQIVCGGLGRALKLVHCDQHHWHPDSMHWLLGEENPDTFVGSQAGKLLHSDPEPRCLQGWAVFKYLLKGNHISHLYLSTILFCTSEYLQFCSMLGILLQSITTQHQTKKKNKNSTSFERKKIVCQGSAIKTISDVSTAALGPKIENSKKVTYNLESYSLPKYQGLSKWTTDTLKHRILQNTNVSRSLAQKATRGCTLTELESESIMQKTWRLAMWDPEQMTRQLWRNPGTARDWQSRLGRENGKLLEEYRGLKNNNLTDSLFDVFGQFFHKI